MLIAKDEFSVESIELRAGVLYLLTGHKLQMSLASEIQPRGPPGKDYPLLPDPLQASSVVYGTVDQMYEPRRMDIGSLGNHNLNTWLFTYKFQSTSVLWFSILKVRFKGLGPFKGLATSLYNPVKGKRFATQQLTHSIQQID